MKDLQRIEPEELWSEDGHVTEAVIAALADGEREIVADEAARHVERCDDCTRRLGEAALASLEVGELVQALPQEALEPVAARAHEAVAATDSGPASSMPLPKLSLAAALLLAALGAVPGLVDVGQSAPSLPADMVRGLPIVADAVGNAAAAVFDGVAEAGTALWAASVLLLMMMGVWIARRPSRTQAGEEGA